MKGELAYPVGHPAHPDYTGAPWKNPGAVFSEDFAPGHPARDGANVRVIDTPDGQRIDHLQHTQDLQALAAMGSLPPLVDDKTGEKIELTPAQLAEVYAVRNGLQAPLAAEVTQRYGLTAQGPRPDEVAIPQPSAEDCALAHIIGLGYTPERAREVLSKYGVPDIQADQRADANR